MIEDSIVSEIRRFRNEHAEKYGHDLKRICNALRELERTSGREIVHRNPKRLLAKTIR
jgi:transposase